MNLEFYKRNVNVYIHHVLLSGTYSCCTSVSHAWLPDERQVQAEALKIFNINSLGNIKNAILVHFVI